MTTTYLVSSSWGAGLRASITANNGVYVAAGVTIGSTDNYALAGTGYDVSMDIDGAVFGQLGALSLTSSFSSSVLIGETGSLGADLNTGTAIDINAFYGQIENHGMIKGSDSLKATGALDLDFTNYGTVRSEDDAIALDAASTGSMQLVNYGRITSGYSNMSLYSSEGNTSDEIINSGVINGLISLGKGDDSYIGAKAKPIDNGYLAFIPELTGTGKIASYVDGGAGADTFYGSRYVDYFAGGAGKDNIVGLGGDDLLLGGGGADQLLGGKGADHFTYQKPSDSHGKTFDAIFDFNQKQHDTIDLASIDASSKPDNQAFKFIGTDTFSGKPGELRYAFDKGDTVITGNTDHDKQPEFELHLDGKIHLHASDFAL